MVDRMEQKTGKQVIRAWTIFVGSSAAWLLLLYALAYGTAGTWEMPWVIHFLVVLVLGLMLLAAVLVSVIWLCEQLPRLRTIIFPRKSGR
jgi:hypothetical protein